VFRLLTELAVEPLDTPALAAPGMAAAALVLGTAEPALIIAELDANLHSELHAPPKKGI